MMNQTNSEKPTKVVMESIVEAHFQGQIQDLPQDLQELFELLLETELSNDINVRIKMLRSLRTARDLAKAVAPFSKQELQKALENI